MPITSCPSTIPNGDGSNGKRRFPCRALHGSKRKPCRRWGKPTFAIQTRLVGNRQLAARPRDGSSPSSLTTRLGKEPTNPPQIRYFDFATNTDNVVPTSGFAAFLSDVSNGHIVYTGLSSTGPFAGSYIFEFNLADSTTTAIGDSNKTSNPTVSAGGDVAYESGAFSANPAETEIVVTELQPGGVQLTTRITDDAMKDSNPQISTDGNHVVWQKGLTTGTGLNIWVADKTAPGVWTSTQLTGASGEDVRPDISGDGRFVTWTSTIAGATDVYVLDRNDNTTYQFDIAGDQRNPSVRRWQIHKLRKQ